MRAANFCAGTGFITAVLVVLKISETISWPWIWVFCPLWAGAIIVVGAMLLIVLILNLGRIIK